MNGNLALSRAIGDFEFKKSAELPPESQIVTAYPDVLEHDITDDDEFLVVACDGKYFLFVCILEDTLTLDRHMGLPVLPSGHRVRSTWYRCKTRPRCDLREPDG